MVKKFEEYINERLVSKSIDRIKSGEKRLGDKTCLDIICEYIGQVVCEELKKEYRNDFCTWEEIGKPETFATQYKIKLNIYNINFKLIILNKFIDDEQRVARDICDAIFDYYLKYVTGTKSQELMKMVYDKIFYEFDV